MKFGKLRAVVTRGAVRVAYKDGDEIKKESFRSMDAVPDTFDNKKLVYVSARDDIKINVKSSDEPVIVRGIEARVEMPEDSNKDKKNKKHDKKKDKKKKKKELMDELGIDTNIIDPSIKDDPIDNYLDTDKKDED